MKAIFSYNYSFIRYAITVGRSYEKQVFHLIVIFAT